MKSSVKTRSYIAQLPWSCSLQFNNLFKEEIEKQRLSLVTSTDCFIATTKDSNLYYKIKFCFSEAICV